MNAVPGTGTQPSLLDEIRDAELELADKLERERYGDPPAQQHSATSREAAASIREHSANLREQVYAAVKASGSFGITDEMISTVTGINPNTVRPRRVELVKDLRIHSAPFTRTTVSGRRATAWLAAT